MTPTSFTKLTFLIATKPSQLKGQPQSLCVLIKSTTLFSSKIDEIAVFDHHLASTRPYDYARQGTVDLPLLNYRDTTPPTELLYTRLVVQHYTQSRDYSLYLDIPWIFS